MNFARMRPVLLIGFLLFCGARAAASPAHDVDTYLNRLVALGFSGNVLIAQHGKITLNRGYGYADREAQTPMGPNTVISIGSITKQFTAAGILKLEMQGKLRVTDRIGRFFPNVPPDKQGITIHELLTHTAGLRPDYGPTDYEPVDRQTYIGRVMHAPLDAKPGSSFSYSNAGYSLLAAIIEIVSHKPYEQYLHENIFVPAGMRDTGYRLARWTVKDIAVGYDGDERWGTIPAHGWSQSGPYWNLLGNGGIESTPRDMFAWHRALQSNTLLSAAERRKYETGYVFEGPMHRSQYAYGWSIQSTSHGKLVTHNGGNGIYAADFLRFVDEGTVVYIASTNSAVPAAVISRNVAKLLFGQDVAIAPAVVPSASLQSRVGTYRTGSGATIEVSAAHGGLDVSSADPEIFAALNAYATLPPGMAADAVTRTQRFVKQPPDDDHPRWKTLVAQVGGLADSQVIGVVSEREDSGVWVAITGKTSKTFAEFIWGQDGLAGVRSSATPPQIRFRPDSTDGLFAYNIANGNIGRIQFNPDGSLAIGDKGEIMALKSGPTN